MADYTITSASATSAIALAANGHPVTMKDLESAKNSVASLMLVCSMCFFMGLFYMVNSPVENVRVKTWQAVSSTVSVFSAITMYQAVRSMVQAFLGRVALPALGMGASAKLYFSTEQVSC